MVDKNKPKAVIGNKPKTKAKESKKDTFIRVCEPRVKSVLKAIRILGNCSNRNNYEYSEKQINDIDMAISKAIVDTMSKFTKSKKEQETFKF